MHPAPSADRTPADEAYDGAPRVGKQHALAAAWTRIGDRPFSNPSSFGQAPKPWYGTPPVAYRRAARRDEKATRDESRYDRRSPVLPVDIPLTRDPA
ncbi:hypothetical protein D5R55_27645 [Burkholderia cenocepacia]|uniref:Uncharacterized protein n=1 Tax=Burkholderia cenocepacia TaxID=95486 RepID=A0A3Q9FC81_9BURK|nr:hypothetical protein D5R55_27645 [Burkholderia cenocepacia]